MKQSYTTFSPYIKAVAKWARTTPERIFEAAFPSGSAVPQERLMEFASVLIQLCVIQGKATHLFMPGREFCDWLVSCVPRLDAEHADIFREALPMSDVLAIGVFHFPTQAHLKSIAFLIPAKADYTGYGLDVGVVDSGCVYLSFSKEGSIENQGRCSCVSMLPDFNAGAAGADSLYYAKLIVGLGMYIHCFPEVLRPGIPDGLKHPSHHQYETPIIVSVSPNVTTVTSGGHASPTPHFRIGHFRVLRSERFTNKRHQVIFVRETFVKGRTATVLSPEETAATATA